MNRDQKIYHHQNLLILALIPFVYVAIDFLDIETYIITNHEKCVVYHQNAPLHLRCEK